MDAGTDRAVVVTDRGFEPIDPGHRILLSRSGPASTPSPGQGPGSTPGLTNAKAMDLALWTYLNVEEVWTGFNLLSEAVAKGFRAEARYKKDRCRVRTWDRDVSIQEKVRMWVKNALVFGRCVMEAGEDFLKVRDPRSIELSQDPSGRVVRVTQETREGKLEIPLERIHVFTLHRLFSDDPRGISAIQPVLQTIDDMVGARRVNRAIQRRYRAPIRLIEMPADATEADRRAVQAQLEETPPDMDLVLPPGAKIRVLNHGDNGVEVDTLMREHLTDRIFMGLGIPKIALGIPDGSNRSVSQTQRQLLLQTKVAPYQRQVRGFAETLYAHVLNAEVTVGFDPVDTRDDEALASVSRTLVDAGIKTPQQVEARYWDWGDGA